MVKQLTSIIVFGASGRMGSRICALASRDDSCALIGAVVRDDSALIGRAVRDVPDESLKFINQQKSSELRGFSRTVVIDFSSDAGARQSLTLATELRAALLIGTTALSAPVIAELRAASSRLPLLITSNTSIGVAALTSAVRAMAVTLGPAYDCSIVESHHAKKKDAPSGTAIRLAQAARDGGARLPDDQIVAIRGGDVIGEHTVRFASAGEYIELTHRATSRDLFAKGALTAAAWLADHPPGWYTMQDVFTSPA